MQLETTHCENCGRPNPATFDGYTVCCNELVCDGWGTQRWTDGKNSVEACCGNTAFQTFKAEHGYVPARMRLEW